MIRTKGEPGTGNVAEAVTHIKKVNDELSMIKSVYDSGDNQDLVRIAREFKVSYDIVQQTAKLGRLPVVNFAAGGIATPADAAYLCHLVVMESLLALEYSMLMMQKREHVQLYWQQHFWNEPESKGSPEDD